MTRRLAAAYLGALAASRLWRSWRSAPMRMAWTDSGPGQAGSTPVLLIHGSPGAGAVMQPLAKLLAPRYRVLVPDLPGFGASAGELSDYSFRAHARYLSGWLEGLGIAQVHVGAYSMGGGVALSLVDIDPQRVASITMISAIGVQEQELTGSYALNHAIHGLQLGALWTLREGVPHFGLLDRFPLNYAYARNFYDSDQRPLRRILTSYGGRMLLIHGDRDRLVPLAAAREHHRLVPQSRLEVFRGGHFEVFQKPETIAGPMLDWLQ